MKGGCFCGLVRYELTIPPQEAYYCHCRDCQYLSGGPFQVLGVVERESLNLITGELSEHNYKTRDGSGMKREFCSECGTPLFVASTRFQGIQMFTASTLDEPDSIVPLFEIWTCSKVSWANVSAEIKSFPCGALDEAGE